MYLLSLWHLYKNTTTPSNYTGRANTVQNTTNNYAQIPDGPMDNRKVSVPGTTSTVLWHCVS